MCHLVSIWIISQDIKFCLKTVAVDNIKMLEFRYVKTFIGFKERHVILFIADPGSRTIIFYLL